MDVVHLNQYNEHNPLYRKIIYYKSYICTDVYLYARLASVGYRVSACLLTLTGRVCSYSKIQYAVGKYSSAQKCFAWKMKNVLKCANIQ